MRVMKETQKVHLMAVAFRATPVLCLLGLGLAAAVGVAGCKKAPEEETKTTLPPGPGIDRCRPGTI